MAQRKRFIRREERNFVETVEGTLEIPSTLGKSARFPQSESTAMVVHWLDAEASCGGV
jgi:hypothetical protein